MKVLRLRDFYIQKSDEKDELIRFLYAHRTTLHEVECSMYFHSEQMLWEVIEFMRRELTLETCNLEVQAWSGEDFAGTVPQLRDVIRRFGGLQMAIKDDELIMDKHGPALDRYILGQPALE